MLNLGEYMGGQMNLVYLDKVKNNFFYLQVGAGASASQQGLTAYTGELPAADGTTTGSFEAVKILYYSATSHFTTRLKSNGQYVWFQSWSTQSSSAAGMPGDTGFDASNPNWGNTVSESGTLTSSDTCLKISASLPNSYYVTPVDGGACLASFGKTKEQMDADSNYTLSLAGTQIKASNWLGKGATMYYPSANPPATSGQCYP
ncbi:hypothetical protein WDW37_17685 [Bdellovibrionota bacterium FG-1]